MYPNPNNGILNIHAGSSIIKEILIFNLQGKLVLQTNINSVSAKVQHTLQQGNYVLQVNTSSNQTVFKLSVQ